MLSSFVDSVLTRYAARHVQPASAILSTRRIDTPVGAVRVYDSGSTGPCVLLVPDGPNVIEHYATLIELLARDFRVVCFDMPGFGFSLPDASYRHSLDHGAAAVLGVMDALGIDTATLAFSCANGFYAMRAAQHAPHRVASLLLSQTPSLAAMHAWSGRIIPQLLRVPVAGQIAAWMFRKRAAHGWYRIALPRTTATEPLQATARRALDAGACFCLASVTQGLLREDIASIVRLNVPCTLIWGTRDHSHQLTDPTSVHEHVPMADIVRFDDCGHFPDIEQPERFAAILRDRVLRRA